MGNLSTFVHELLDFGFLTNSDIYFEITFAYIVHTPVLKNKFLDISFGTGSNAYFSMVSFM